jgi:hypothetical protein
MPDRPALQRHALLGIFILAAVLLASSAQAALAKRGPARPRVTTFAFSPSTFSVGAARAAGKGKRVTTLRFMLSKRATVKVAMSHKLAGRRSGGHCVKPTAKLAKHKACTRYHHVGTIVRARLRAGRGAIAFSGRIGRHPLPLGTYRARLWAVDSQNHRSKARTASFTITAAAPASGAPAPAPAPAQKRVVRPCGVTLPTVAAVQSAVTAAAPGAVVCLANGSFGKLALTGKAPAEVVVQPATPGGATIAGATLTGSHLTLSGFNVVGDEVTVEPGSDHMTVEYNKISGGHFGVDAGPTDSTTVDDFIIRGNKFVGNFGEDAIRLNRYHDADGDGVGALIEGNEITGVVEDGQHNDCLQTVWVGDHLVFRRNYLHGNNCQGFFVKDQDSAIDSIVFDDNLIVDHNLPCQPASLCPNWVLAPVQIFGPLGSLTMTHNTVWTPFDNGGVYVRGSGWGSFNFSNNVMYHLSAPDGAAPFASYSAANNVVCNRDGPWPATGIAGTCSMPFLSATNDDYRLPSGAGVDWAPADQQFGP